MRRLSFVIASMCAIVVVVMSGASTVRAQRVQNGVEMRPDDPLSNRDATRPDRNEYELRTTVTGTPSQVDAALKYAKEALDAKPPRYADAEKYYLEAAKLNPKEERPYVGLGTVYAAQDRVQDAIDAFRKAAELKPKSGIARFNLGVIFVATGREEEATTQYTALEKVDKSLAQKLHEMMTNRFKKR